jgi:DNA polymerase elongation subunit (family B)
MGILDFIKIETVLFLDIETAPQWYKLHDAPENVRHEWIYKFKFRPEAPPESEHCDIYENYFAELWEREAGLHAEFSRIVCISVGFMFKGDFYMKSYYDVSEGDLLRKFNEDLASFTSMNPQGKVCAHYGKLFDFPFIGKRMIINRIKIPLILDTAHLKPWEVPNIDTWEIWKAGLPAICMALGLETPKDDLNGSKVSWCFHIEKDLKRIAVYCEKDVFALLNVFKCIRLEEPLKIEQIVNRNE